MQPQTGAEHAEWMDRAQHGAQGKEALERGQGDAAGTVTQKECSDWQKISKWERGQPWWHHSVIPARRRLRQEHHPVQATQQIPRPARAVEQDLVSKTEQNKVRQEIRCLLRERKAEIPEAWHCPRHHVRCVPTWLRGCKGHCGDRIESQREETEAQERN